MSNEATIAVSPPYREVQLSPLGDVVELFGHIGERHRFDGFWRRDNSPGPENKRVQNQQN